MPRAKKEEKIVSEEKKDVESAVEQPEEKKAKPGKDSVTVLYEGKEKTFTQLEHGDDFAEDAERFRVARKGEYK